jgi:hypothetical protein
MRRICPHCRGSGYLAPVSPAEEIAERFLAETAEDFQLTPEEIQGPGRRQDIVAARRYMARELRRRGLRLKEIGAVLGNRDHSTVINLLSGKRARTGNAEYAAGESRGRKSS